MVVLEDEKMIVYVFVTGFVLGFLFFGFLVVRAGG